MKETPENIEQLLPQFVTNRGKARTRQLAELVTLANRELGFLELGEPVYVIERNRQDLQTMTDILTEQLEMTQYVMQRSKQYRFAHHNVEDGYINTYQNTDTQSPISRIIYREKHPDSAAEKIARDYAEERDIKDPNNDDQLRLKDQSGITVVVKNADDMGTVIDRIKKTPGFRELRHKQVRKENGYTADHLVMVYTGVPVEVQITTERNYENSKTKPGQRHDVEYADRKLALRHESVPQLIIYCCDNSVTIPQGIAETKKAGIFKVTRIEHEFQPYYLVQTDEN